jgi:hypothetical protein
MTTVPATAREVAPLALAGADEAGEAEDAASDLELDGAEVESAVAALPEEAAPEEAVAEARPEAEPPLDTSLLLAASDPL